LYSLNKHGKGRVVDTTNRHGKGAVFFVCTISEGLCQTLPNRTSSGRDIILKHTSGPYVYMYIYIYVCVCVCVCVLYIYIYILTGLIQA
jgi:hypothetical protein